MEDEYRSFKCRIRMRPSLKEAVCQIADKEARSFATMAGVLLQEALTARSSA